MLFVLGCFGGMAKSHLMSFLLQVHVQLAKVAPSREKWDDSVSGGLGSYAFW